VHTSWKKNPRLFDLRHDDAIAARRSASPPSSSSRASLRLSARPRSAPTAYSPADRDDLCGSHVAERPHQPPLYGNGHVILCTGDGGLRWLAVLAGRPAATSPRTPSTDLQQKRSVAVVADPGGRICLYFANESECFSCIDAKTEPNLSGRSGWAARFSGLADLRRRPALFLDKDGATMRGRVRAVA